MFTEAELEEIRLSDEELEAEERRAKAANREKILQQKREYYQANRERILARRREKGGLSNA